MRPIATSYLHPLMGYVHFTEQPIKKPDLNGDTDKVFRTRKYRRLHRVIYLFPFHMSEN